MGVVTSLQLAVCISATAGHYRCADCGPVHGRTQIAAIFATVELPSAGGLSSRRLLVFISFHAFNGCLKFLNVYFRSHGYTQCLDAAYCYGFSVFCLCVCLWVTKIIFTFFTFLIVLMYKHQYTLCLKKKQDTKLLPITSPNVNRFSKFFHWQTHW